MNFPRLPCLVVLSLCATLLLGCSNRRPARVAVQRVQGRLLVNCAPAGKASIYFHPRQRIVGANPLPFAVVASDGTYRPSTYSQGDGLPPGEYLVTVVWPRYIPFDGQEIPSDDQLQGAYADPRRPVQTVTITTGANELPVIDLKL